MSKKFEDSLKKAKDSLDKLMSNEISLEESLKLYKDGMTQLNKAQEILDDTKIQFDDLVKEYEK